MRDNHANTHAKLEAGAGTIRLNPWILSPRRREHPYAPRGIGDILIGTLAPGVFGEAIVVDLATLRHEQACHPR